jgi:hypothetical protein
LAGEGVRTLEIFYSSHAGRRLGQHGISDEDIVDAISQPDCKWKDLEGRTVVRTRVRGRQLCVVYKIEFDALDDGAILVVTAYPIEEESYGDQDRRVVG